MGNVRDSFLWNFGAFWFLFTNGNKVVFSKILNNCCPHWKKTPARSCIERQKIVLEWHPVILDMWTLKKVAPWLPYRQSGQLCAFLCWPVFWAATILSPAGACPLGMPLFLTSPLYLPWFYLLGVLVNTSALLPGKCHLSRRKHSCSSLR